MYHFENRESIRTPEKSRAEREELVAKKCKFQAKDGRCRFQLFTGVNESPQLAKDGKCQKANNSQEQLSCNRFSTDGNVFEIGPRNWSMALTSAIILAKDNDIIVVSTADRAELGRIAHVRMKPCVDIKFVVDPEA